MLKGNPSLTPDRSAKELLVEVLLTQGQLSSSLAVMSMEVLKIPVQGAIPGPGPSMYKTGMGQVKLQDLGDVGVDV